MTRVPADEQRLREDAESMWNVRTLAECVLAAPQERGVINLYLARDLARAALAAVREAAELREALRDLKILVDEQAEDEALWAIYPMGVQPISEAYLQQELRRLHEAIERCAGLVADPAAEEPS